jgi:hypothetical protein
MTPKDAVRLAREQQAEAVDFKFMDLLGTWQHFTIPMSEYEEAIFDEGLGFDGSSIRGWQPINASDMLVMPDASTAVIDPFCAVPTLSLICNIVDPITKEEYSRDPRNIARKAEAYLKSTGIGFLFSMMFVSTKINTKRTIISIRSKGCGTLDARKAQISARRSVTKKATSQSLRSIPNKIFVPKWCNTWSVSAFALNVSIMKSPPPAKPKLICVFLRW